MLLLTNTQTLDFQLANVFQSENQHSVLADQEALFDPLLASFWASKRALKVAVIGAPVDYDDPLLRPCLIGYHDFPNQGTDAKMESIGTQLAKESRLRSARLSQKEKGQIQLIAANVVNRDGAATMFHVVKAFHWVLELQADVIYCHLNGKLESFWLNSIMKEVERKKIVCIAPAHPQLAPVALAAVKTNIVAQEGPFMHTGTLHEGPWAAT